MPNLIETYAMQTGLQIDKPVPQEHFIPLPDGPYILVNASSGMASKNYDYFNEVVRLLAPLLPEYKFAQIGNKDDVPLNGVIHLQGATTIPQMMYVIKHCTMLIGNDSSAAHIASVYDKLIVALYGSTHPKIHGPHSGWGKVINRRLLEPDRKGKKPSYSAQEPVKTVNQIPPEKVANAALELLGKPLIKQETLHIGGKYHGTTLELICDQILPPQDFPNGILNARMDYHFDENMLFQNLMRRKLCIITDKPINVEGLKQMRPNVALLVYILNEDYDIEFVKKLREGGINYNIVANLEGDVLAKAKLDFFDYANVLPRRKIVKSDLENHSKIGTTSLYRSNRFILSNGKIFLNKLAWRAGESVPNQRENEGPVIDHPDFWEDVDYFYIYSNGAEKTGGLDRTEVRETEGSLKS